MSLLIAVPLVVLGCLGHGGGGAPGFRFAAFVGPPPSTVLVDFYLTMDADGDLFDVLGTDVDEPCLRAILAEQSGAAGTVRPLVLVISMPKVNCTRLPAIVKKLATIRALADPTRDTVVILSFPGG